MKKLGVLFLLVFCFFSNEFLLAQYKRTEVLNRKEYESRKKNGLLEHGVRYEIEHSGATPPQQTAKYTYVPGDNEIMTAPCGQLPPLTYTVVQFDDFGTYDSQVDDASSDLINLGFNFCFYGTTYNACYINSNGNITFVNGQTSFSSTGFPNASDVMIAPFWADFDNSGGDGFVRYSMGNLGGGNYFAVKWDQMGYFPSMGDKLNTCTLIITDGVSSVLPSGNNVGFFYEDMNWTTGSASGGTNGFGGTAATAGMNKGDGINFIQIGRFDTSGTVFISNVALNNGVDWLDNKSFFFDLCAAGNNIAPVSVNFSSCDTIMMCAYDDTLLLENYFASPETDQITSVTVTAPTLGANFTSYLNQSGATAHVISEIITNPGLSGYHTITYTATDNGTPAQTTTINLTLYINNNGPIDPSLSISPQGICPGQDATVTLSNCTQYDYSYWSNGTSGCSFTTSDPQTDYLTVTDTSGCWQTTWFNVGFTPAPIPVVQGNLSFCGGQSGTTLQLAPPTPSEPNYASILWSDGSTGNTVNLGVGSYTVTVTGDNGCVGDTSFSITNNGPPDFMASNDTCVGSMAPAQLNVNFNCISTVSCALSTPCPGGTSQNYTVGTGSAAANSSTGFPTPYGNWYRNSRHQFLVLASELTAMGATAGNISSLSFNVTATNSIGALPNFTIKLKCTSLTTLPAQTYSTGDQFISGTVQVFSTPSYNVVTGINTHTFTQPYAWDGVSNLIVETCFDQSPSYTYNAAVTQSNTPFISTINAYADSYPVCTSPVTSNASFYNYTQRPDMTFKIISSVNPSNYTYSWSPTTGLSNPNIKNPTATLSSGIVTYTVTVTTLDGNCSNTDSVQVTVGSGVNIVTSDSIFCDNDPVTPFTLAAGSTTGGTWSHHVGGTGNGGGIVVNGTGVDFHPELSALGTSYVVYNVSNSTCPMSDSVEVSVNHYFSPAFTPIGPFCEYDAPVTLSSLATTNGGAWTINGNPATTFDPAVIGASASPDTLMYYQPNGGVCPDSQIVMVMVHPKPIVDVVPLPDSIFCDNTGPYQIGLSASTSGTTGTWAHHESGSSSPGGGLTTTSGNPVTFYANQSVAGISYVVYTYTDNNGCVNSDSLQVEVNQHIPATFSSVGPFCEYDPDINLNAIANYTPGTWTINGNANSTFSPATLGPSTSPGYLIKYVTNSNGCKDSSSSYVTVYPKPTVDFSADTLSGCLPSVPIAFTNTVTGTPATSGAYSWSFGDGGTTGLSNPVHVYTKPGSQSVSLTFTDINGCIATEIKYNYILINNVPEPDFTFDPQIPTYLEPHVDFTNTTTNGGGYTWNWDIANLDSSTNYNTSFDFPTYGDFYVTLTATSAVGCVGSITHPVSVKPDYVLYVPNAFSPNGDGKNDVFIPQGDGVQTDGYLMSIYDRWGEKVFETSDITVGWKGSNNNSDNIYLESGVYVYKIIYKDPDLKGHEVVGHVTVIR